jgi:hypothetical protein
MCFDNPAGNEISDPRFREDRFQKGIVCLFVDASEYE